MKFSSIVSLFALTTVAAAGTVPVEKRAASSAMSIVTGLYSDIKQYTGAINSTTAGLSKNPSAAEKAAATKKIKANVKKMTHLVTDATSDVKELSSKEKRDAIVPRQSATNLANEIVTLLTEISGALNNVLATLGLSSLLGPLGPLVNSLSLLLLALDVVVDQLLALVRQIVDGLLIGLSLALAGLIL